MKKKLILITDGDNIAREAVEIAAKNLNVSCISRSAFRNGEKPACYSKLVRYIEAASHDVVLVMFDDRGNRGEGAGEKTLKLLVGHKEFEVLGALAVASNTYYTSGCKPDFSIDRTGDFFYGPVDKHGYHEKKGNKYVEGDTVDILSKLKGIPLVIGIGDLGKMEGADLCASGAPITTKAIKEILQRSGVWCFAKRE